MRTNLDFIVPGCMCLKHANRNWTQWHSVMVGPASRRQPLVGGGFTSFNGTNRNSIARPNPNGTPDTSFDLGTGANNIVYGAAPQPGGKVIIGGAFTSF